ncbi:hypothetical protein [Catenulispora sp. MAP5-51]|uniref:hypothetical protein n=1 Tax=Catenulispora sp. MAP5-51 TaxID=3156298 RepID=UPI003516EAE0
MATEDPDLPSARSSNDEPQATHANGTVPVEAAVSKRDDQVQVVEDAAKGKKRKQEKDEPRATSTVDVSKEASSDAKVADRWSFLGVSFGRIARLMGSADKYQRRAGYTQLFVVVFGSLAALAIVAAAFAWIGVYGGKAALAGTTATVATTTGAGFFLQHQRKKSREVKRKTANDKKDD